MSFGKMTISVCFVVFYTLNCKSQLQSNYWYFGKYKGLYFGGGAPAVLTNSNMYAFEGCATISDNNGQLLFYTNGTEVYNRNHLTMQNGTGLYGDERASQSAIILPVPNDAYKYYIFTVDAYPFTIGVRPCRGINYSIVDISKNGGLGEVTVKNIPVLPGNVCEKIGAVKHCNGRDLWIIGKSWGDNRFHSFLVTPNGIQSPVVSAVGSVINQSPCQSNGYMKISPNGKMLAAAYTRDQHADMVELFDFDNGTGTLSNFRQITGRSDFYSNCNENGGYYGIEFSPDSKLLYSTAFYQEDLNNPFKSYLFQYDVTQPTSVQIKNSEYALDSISGVQWGAVQQAPDGKIYITGFYQHFLNAIDNPNGSGASCNYRDSAIRMLSGFNDPNYIYYGLPTVFSSIFYDPVIASGNCQFSNITFSLSGISNLLSANWNFGDPASGVNNTSTSPNPTHIFSSQGIYRVRLAIQLQNGCRDTIYKTVSAGPLKVFLGNDTTICLKDTLTLRMKIPGASIIWDNNSYDTIYKVTKPGKYSVKVQIGECIAKDTIEVFNRALPQFTLGDDAYVCNTESITLATNPSFVNAKYLWNTNVVSPTITVSTPGLYWLHLTDVWGCRLRDTINVLQRQLPQFNLGKDTAICQSDTLQLNATVTGASDYLWSDGSISSVKKIYQQGIYWCDVKKDGCIYRDSIIISINPLPEPNLGVDKELCGNPSVMLNPGTNGTNTYLWNDNSTSSSLTVNQTGIYWVEVKNSFNCYKRDSVSLLFKPYPVFNLGKDTSLCEGEFLNKVINIGNATYLWNNGNISNQFQISNTGTYWLDVTINGCTKRDSISVLFKSMPVVSLGNDTTLCEGTAKLLDASNKGSVYKWQNSSVSQTYSVTQPGQYFVFVNKDGCISSDTILVNYKLKPRFSLGSDKYICSGDTIVLDPIIANDVVFKWQDGSNNQKFAASLPGLYSVEVSNICGALKDELELKYGLCKILLPSAFTPNNDRINDVFKPLGTELISSLKFAIYNRWGQLIYQTTDKEKGWDGSFNGQHQPPGNYIWIMEYKVTGEEQINKIKGFVLLIR
jgi:gliding motility-associated-like protein